MKATLTRWGHVLSVCPANHPDWQIAHLQKGLQTKELHLKSINTAVANKCGVLNTFDCVSWFLAHTYEVWFLAYCYYEERRMVRKRKTKVFCLH